MEASLSSERFRRFPLVPGSSPIGTLAAEFGSLLKGRPIWVGPECCWRSGLWNYIRNRDERLNNALTRQTEFTTSIICTPVLL